MKILLAVILAVGIAGCATRQMAKVEPGERLVGERLAIKVDGPWNHLDATVLAPAEAWTMDCHHVLMQSGRADPRVHRFYQLCGFEPGHRIGYVVRRPA